MKALIIIVFTLTIVFECRAQKSIIEQSYEVEVITKNGVFCNFYFQYSISSQLYQTKRDQIHIKLDEELLKITDQYTLTDIVNAIDSIGLSIGNEIKNVFDLVNLKVKEIRVDHNWREYLDKKGVNLDRVKINTGNGRKNYARSTKSRLEVKSSSGSLSLVLKTKENSDVRIKYVINFTNTFKNPFESLDQHIQNSIVDSLSQFTMYELWTSLRHSISQIMEGIIKTGYPETYSVLVLDIVIPKKAKTYFLETEKIESDIYKTLIEIFKKKESLTKKIETNSDLSKSENIETIKKIERLEDEETVLLKKVRLLNYDYKQKKQ